MIRILIPTDFSDHSINALKYAQLLFQKEVVEFTVLHAYEPSALQFLGNKSPSALKRVYGRLKINTLKQMEDLKAGVCGSSQFENHTYNWEAREGHLSNIIDELLGSDYEYIVMGSKGATGLKEIFFGSTTFDIVSLRHTIPLLIVPEHAEFVELSNIGFATDFQNFYFKEELNPLLKLAKLWESTVRTIKIYDTLEISEKQKRHLQKLKGLLSDVDFSFHVIEKYSSIENCIYEFKEDLEIDLMVMIDYSKSFFEHLVDEPVIKRISFHTKLPFLIFPEAN
ncbi:universal stress protein [Nonlabens sp. Ci31]|uniref:universal stress protein n=1 Tax=Nonlabens sp. Ci31 TaxID=2608253 RepID=UPI001464559F|nr:universal stress protein [Nonlabens sp. Ci31]QJP35666.1 universal stress protein [Nonlabens sp. Ci31]